MVLQGKHDVSWPMMETCFLEDRLIKLDLPVMLHGQQLTHCFSLHKGGGSPQLYYHDCSGRIPGHTTRAPQVGFELETNGFQFYAIANLLGKITTHLQPHQHTQKVHVTPFKLCLPFPSFKLLNLSFVQVALDF